MDSNRGATRQAKLLISERSSHFPRSTLFFRERARRRIQNLERETVCAAKHHVAPQSISGWPCPYGASSPPPMPPSTFWVLSFITGMAQSPDHFSAPTAAASLYCAEDVEDVVSWDSDTWISDPGSSPLVYAHSPPFDESTIERFFGSEPDHRPMEDYLCRCRDRSVDVTSRQDSINWILKVGVCMVKYGNGGVVWSGLVILGDAGACILPLQTSNGDSLRQLLGPFSLSSCSSGMTVTLNLTYPEFAGIWQSCLVGAARQWVAVSAVICGMFVFGSENGGNSCTPTTWPPNVSDQVRVWTQNYSENGAMGHGQSQLEITLCHSLRFHRLLRLQAPLLFRFQARPSYQGLLRFCRSHSQHHPW